MATHHPATQSPTMIRVIREDIGFAGLLMTDDLNMQALAGTLADRTARPPEVAGEGGLFFRLKPVEIPEFEFVNLYGTDITAERAIDKFPNQNPNPVLRLTRQGRMTYANPASALVLQ